MALKSGCSDASRPIAAIIVSLSAATGRASTRRFQTFVAGKIAQADSGGIAAAVGPGRRRGKRRGGRRRRVSVEPWGAGSRRATRCRVGWMDGITVGTELLDGDAEPTGVAAGTPEPPADGSAEATARPCRQGRCCRLGSRRRPAGPRLLDLGRRPSSRSIPPGRRRPRSRPAATATIAPDGSLVPTWPQARATPGPGRAGNWSCPAAPSVPKRGCPRSSAVSASPASPCHGGSARTRSWSTPFVATIVPPSKTRRPSKSVIRPPASSTSTAGAATSQILRPSSTMTSAEPSATRE